MLFTFAHAAKEMLTNVLIAGRETTEERDEDVEMEEKKKEEKRLSIHQQMKQAEKETIHILGIGHIQTTHPVVHFEIKNIHNTNNTVETLKTYLEEQLTNVGVIRSALANTNIMSNWMGDSPTIGATHDEPHDGIVLNRSGKKSFVQLQ